MRTQASSHSKQEFVYHEILKRITTGEVPIGEHISTEKELASEFACSRGTVGRAIVRLVQEGLVECKQRTGTRVIRNTLSRPPVSLDLDACALICPSEQHEGVWRTIRGFQQAAHEVNRRTVVMSTGADFRKEAEIVGRLGEFNVKGAVLYPVVTNPTEMAYYSQMILNCAFPIVLAELAIPGMGRPTAVVDGLHAGYTMTRYLIGQGSKRIGFVAHYAWAPFVRDRYLGYRHALEEAGLCENPGSVFLESTMNPDFDDPTAESFLFAQRYLDRKPSIEAVVCGTDFMALGMLRAARSRGLRVPEDLKVTGVDDYTVAATAEVPLTTYRIPYETQGRKAFEMLGAEMNTPGSAPTETQIRGELVVRQSA